MKNEEQITFSRLIEKVKTYITDEKQVAVIENAYEYAKEKHKDQVRLSGDEYITHPINVAHILTSIYSDYSTIATALLHDVINFCNVEVDELKEAFGEEIAFLVEGVSKINKLSLSADSEATVQMQRKIIVGLAEDVRIIIVKLAERLHNLRTLWAIPKDKQREKAKESLEILAPIAHRLGIQKIKSELEDLSLRYYKPDVYESIVEKLNATKLEREATVHEMMDNVSILLKEHGIEHEIKGRAKSIYSIYNKLQNNNKKYSEIYDYFALRVYVKLETECYTSLGIIHAKYKPMPKRFKDYIAMPKPNGYQSLHTTVFAPDGNPFEIQIRTYDMDKVAEYGFASHWSYKEGKNTQSSMDKKLQFFRTLIEASEEKNIPEEEIAIDNEIFNDSIYVYTPKGDVVEMPIGSTPIDFAYRVHSRIGETMVGAIVNDVIVPLDYELKTGDIIKINTNKNSKGPSKEWINLAKTNQAKTKIRAFFGKALKEENIKKGEDLLLKEIRKQKISINDIINDENFSILNDEYKIDNKEELFLSIGNGKFTPGYIINFLTKEKEDKSSILLNKIVNQMKQTDSKNEVLVSGIDDIKVTLANCCKPVKGDSIIGYITKGNGIAVHRKSCYNIINQDERLIDVSWNESLDKKYLAEILVYAKTSDKVLVDIISRTSLSEVSIQSLNTIVNEDGNVYTLNVAVNGIEHLNKYISDISQIQNVVKVERNLS